MFRFSFQNQFRFFKKNEIDDFRLYSDENKVFCSFVCPSIIQAYSMTKFQTHCFIGNNFYKIIHSDFDQISPQICAIFLMDSFEAMESFFLMNFKFFNVV